MSRTSSPKRRPLGQPPGINPPLRERILDVALKHIAAEDAQAREARIIRIRRMVGAAAGEAHARRREVHLDHIGDIDARDIGAVRSRWPGMSDLEHEVD